MELKYKPDLDRAKMYWNAFWNREIIDRPCVYITAPKDGVERKERPPYMAGYDGKYEKALKMFDEWASSTYFGGEAIPFFEISFGPDQFSAFLGAELIMAEDERTSWAKPFVTDWRDVRMELDTRDNSAWNRMLEYMRFAAKFSEGKFLIGMLDLHSNMDCLSAIRGPENLCVDIIDCPDEVERVLKEVRALYAPVYEALYEAGDMRRRGSIGWAPFYSEGKFATIQCDFICMIGPEHARRFVIPALSEEASFLDHSVYHYDGPGALVHLDDILSIPEIDVIQWVPGDGNPPLIEWMDLLKRIQKAKKGLQIYNCSVEEVKRFHKELRPEGVLYCVSASSRREADELVSWLRKNT
ncbi:MAG: hypothetical protein ACUVXI_00700 [bacterium]